MSNSNKAVFDRFVEALLPAERLRDEQIMTLTIRADVARVWLDYVRLARDVDGAKMLKSKSAFNAARAKSHARAVLHQLAVAESNVRLAQAARRQFDEVLSGEARLWFWCVLLAYPTTEFIMAVLP